MAERTNPLRVIFIGGPGRSGSTVIEKIMGEIDGVAALGEVVYIWERGFKLGQSCGCGTPFNKCAVWREIRQAAFPGVEDFDPLLRTSLQVERFRHFPFYLLSSLFPRFQAKVRLLGENLLRLYRGAASVHGVSTLVDSSKHMHGHVLAAIPEIDLRVIHMVRDARATVFSWGRAKVYEVTDGEPVYMPRISTSAATCHWILDNLSSELLRIRGNRYMRVRYEDFAREPTRVVEEILEFAQLPGSSNPVSHEGIVDFGEQHSLSGNPVRFGRGVTTIRLDDEWKTEMRWIRKAWITLLAWPLLLRYRYLEAD